MTSAPVKECRHVTESIPRDWKYCAWCGKDILREPDPREVLLDLHWNTHGLDEFVDAILARFELKKLNQSYGE